MWIRVNLSHVVNNQLRRPKEFKFKIREFTLNPRNTRPKTVLENEYRVLVSEYRKPKNGRNGVPFPKNSVDPQTETRGLWVVWGA